jgi:hypothetical protein
MRARRGGVQHDTERVGAHRYKAERTLSTKSVLFDTISLALNAKTGIREH